MKEKPLKSFSSTLKTALKVKRCQHLILFYCYCWVTVFSRCRESEPSSQSSSVLWPGDVQQLFKTKESRSDSQDICFMVTQCCISTFHFLGITLAAPGPAAGSNMWDHGKTHGAPRASGLCPVGLHPLLWLLHLLLPCTSGIQSIARQPGGVLQHLLKWATAGGSILS